MSGIVEKNTDMEINNSDSPIEQLNQNVNGLPEYFAELDPPLIRTSVLEKKKQSEASVEKVSAEKKVELQKHIIEQSQSALELSKSNTTDVAKKQVTVNKSIDKQKTKTPILENKKPSESTDKITSAKKKTNNVTSASDWSVNLTAYTQLSDAKRKAAKFIQKGIPVKVVEVDVNNTKWYRLKVGGFKNKENAASYAAKIKKSLNLNTVFVGNI
jgi:cell division protein FtsN